VFSIDTSPPLGTPSPQNRLTIREFVIRVAALMTAGMMGVVVGLLAWSGSIGTTWLGSDNNMVRTGAVAVLIVVTALLTFLKVEKTLGRIIR